MELDIENKISGDSQHKNDHENPKESDHEEVFENSNEISLLLIGENFKSYWPLDLQYYRCTVDSVGDGKCKIYFDDGDTVTFDMSQEVWNYQENSNKNMVANNLRVTSNEQEVLGSMFKTFGNKSFLKYQCLG